MPPVVTPLEPWQTAWPALPALVLALWGAWRLREELRWSRALSFTAAAALAARVWAIPVERHLFDGHEAEYLDLFTGQRALSRGGPMLYPAMQWLYAGLGRVLDDPRWLLGLNVAASVGAVLFTQAAVARRLGPGPGLVAGLWLALWGNHAAWASSAYNVTLPHLLVALGAWALVALTRGAEPWGAGALAGGALGLALCTRVESALVVPALGGWALIERPAGAARALPGLALGLGLGAVGAVLVLWPGQTPGEEQRALAWAMNHTLLAYYAPFDHPALLGLLGLGLGLLALEAPGLAVLAALWAGGAHLAGATFEDYGARHLLNGGLGLAWLAAGLATRGWGRVLALGALVPIGLDLREVGQRYYAEEERFAQTLDPALPVWGLAELPGCAWVCEDSRVVEEGQQRSHFNLWDPAEAEGLRAEQGCVVWLRGVEDWRWSSRAVHDRAVRLRHLYTLRPLAVVKDPERGYVAEVIEVGPRRDPGLLEALQP